MIPTNRDKSEIPEPTIGDPWTWAPLRNIRVGDCIKLDGEEWTVAEENVYTRSMATKSIGSNVYGRSTSEMNLGIIQGVKRHANVNVDTGVITYRDTPGGTQQTIEGQVAVKWAPPNIVEMFRS